MNGPGAAAHRPPLIGLAKRRAAIKGLVKRAADRWQNADEVVERLAAARAVIERAPRRFSAAWSRMLRASKTGPSSAR